MSLDRAWTQVGEWLACRPVWVPEPTERHAAILGALLPGIGGKSNFVPDAHLAALAMEYGLVLQSTDHDFSRFHGLIWENPLTA